MRANINMGEAGDVLLEDLEGLLREINEFCSAIHNKPEEIPQSLERYLNYVARSGNTVFPWQHVRPLFRSKILQSMGQFPGEICPNNESFVLERFDLFRAAPFTIQRLTELITQPTRHYKKKEKFIRGLEKTVLVVSTVEPWSVDNDMRNGNDSASDGEMDQTYSESDDSSANRTFTMDHHDLMISSGGGIHVEGEHIDLLNTTTVTSPDRLQNVTTTMINITSNGNQSTTTTIGSTSTSLSTGEGMPSHEMSSSELGLSAVITPGDNSDELVQPNSSNILPINIEQVGEPVTRILSHGPTTVAEEIPPVEITADFEPIMAPSEQVEIPNQQSSSNLIVVNIEPVVSETANEISAVSETEISEGILIVPEETVEMELDELQLPVIVSASVEESGDSNSNPNPELLEQKEQLTAVQPLIQGEEDKEVKDALVAPPILDKTNILENVIPIIDQVEAAKENVQSSEAEVIIPGLETTSATVVELPSEESTKSEPAVAAVSDIPGSDVVADFDKPTNETSPPLLHPPVVAPEVIDSSDTTS